MRQPRQTSRPSSDEATTSERADALSSGAAERPRQLERYGRANGGNGDSAVPFDEVAQTLLENGYSPIPLIGKRPIEHQWTKWCRRQPTTPEIAEAKGNGHNVGAATGLHQLIGNDIDSDDNDIVAAVRSVIGESSVAKRGQRGRTDFYRMPMGTACPSRQFRHKDSGKVLVEVLGDGRQSVIPPSIHPDTKEPYAWLTDATLLDTCIDELPECPADLIERLEAALKPWLPQEKPARPQRSGPPPILTEGMKRRHRAWALKALDARAKELVGQTKPGRDRMLFAHVCALGRHVHHGIVTDAELRNPLIDACAKNRLVEENGRRACHRTIDNGLRYALADHLDDLPDREPPTGRKARVQEPNPSQSNGSTSPPPPPPRDPPDAPHGSEPHGPAWQPPEIRITGGSLSRNATDAEHHLLAEGVEIYQRDGKLVRPITEDVSASDKRKTTVAALREVSEPYMRDLLCRRIRWLKYVRETWVQTNPTKEIANTILGRAGEWKFPVVNGVISTPTIRPDGSLLVTPGYDPTTRLILVDPPALPPIPQQPTWEDAMWALELLKSLLVEFPFVDNASRSVALSALITPVVRGAMSVVPMHLARAHVAGTGKSYLWDTSAAIATGRDACHVIAAAPKEEETEKRLVACALAGYPLFSIDNVNGDLLGGDFLCQLIERPIINPRILGQSKVVHLVNAATVFGTGNNVRIVGDMTRRTIVASLDAKVERPELRNFQFDPVKKVLADRGRYVAAVLTIVRAHITAGYPSKISPPLASFTGWSDMVRSALVWLGEADPIDTLDVARAEDPVLRALSAFLAAWREVFGTGQKGCRSTGEILAAADQKGHQYDDMGHVKGSTKEFKHPELHEAIDQIVGSKDRPRALGWWLSRHAGRPIDGHRIMRDDQNKKVPRWYVEQV
jgi:putative DNA primase/helicase